MRLRSIESISIKNTEHSEHRIVITDTATHAQLFESTWDRHKFELKQLEHSTLSQFTLTVHSKTSTIITENIDLNELNLINSPSNSISNSIFITTHDQHFYTTSIVDNSKTVPVASLPQLHSFVHLDQELAQLKQSISQTSQSIDTTILTLSHEPFQLKNQLQKYATINDNLSAELTTLTTAIQQRKLKLQQRKSSLDRVNKALSTDRQTLIDDNQILVQTS